MNERIISIQVHWSERAEDGARTLLGLTPVTRTDDDADPEPVFVEKALLAPQIVNAFEKTAFPALIAARATKLAALEPIERRKARDAEAAEARRARAEAEREQLDADVAARRAELKTLDDEIARKRADADAAPEAG